MYLVWLITWAKPSRQSIRGGRPGDFSSERRSWKMGHAFSGSEAPRRARREREMLGGRGTGMSVWEGFFWESGRSERMGLAREMAVRRAAVLAGWV